ncbi:hypothetical protein [Rodentibacter mrazii]|nr:hypothetical protein [Rodentibacter mrazii]
MASLTDQPTVYECFINLVKKIGVDKIGGLERQDHDGKYQYYSRRV